MALISKMIIVHNADEGVTPNWKWLKLKITLQKNDKNNTPFFSILKSPSEAEHGKTQDLAPQ